jgi:hypothetical protein
VFLGIQGAAGWYFNGIATPLAFRSVELNVAAPAADALPGLQRDIPDIAEDSIKVSYGVGSFLNLPKPALCPSFGSVQCSCPMLYSCKCVLVQRL